MMEDKHGDKNWNNRPKIKRTCLNKYGMPKPPSYKYTYESLHFDSSWEIAFYIWHKDHNVMIQYPCDVTF